MDSNNQNKENPHILKELKSMNRQTKYILVDRNRGKTVRFDDRDIRDVTKPAVIEDVIKAKNLHIALNKALAELPPHEYQIILECFFVTIQNNKKIVYLHKRNFEISNSRHADERSTNWSYAMLSRDTKIAS